MSFKSYVTSKEIYEFEKLEGSKPKEYSEASIYEHVNVLCDLHGRLKGCSIPINNMVNKMVEDFKVSEVFLKQDIERYKFNPKNSFEKKVSEFGDEALYRIRKVLDVIDGCNYENMILRSMKNKEVCVYNVSLNDFYMGSDLKIYVRSIGDFCENILEYDYVKFFTRAKRSNRAVDFVRTCAYICSKEQFGIDSYNFILACTSFPYEFVRVISKYRDLGRDLSGYSDECNFDDVLKKDGESLV